MTEYVFSAVSALWLGVLTSISPCPLATNLAAISYIGRKAGSPRQVFLTGLLYTLGRTVAYLGLACVLVTSVLAVPQVSLFLQSSMHQVLGPLLIIVGMLLTGLIQIRSTSGGVGESLKTKVDALGIWGALLLGVVFALTFCPTSAALFFGSLMPLSLKVKSQLTLPIAYGVGSALPAIVFAGLLATSTQLVGKFFNILTKVEWWARMFTGAIFIGLGLYFALKYIFQVV